MEALGAALVAVLGSTGLIGILTASLQLSRRSRLKRSIQTATEIADSIAPGSLARKALQQAIETDVLRLAAMSMVELRARTRYMITMVLVMFGFAVGVGLVVFLTFPDEALGTFLFRYTMGAAEDVLPWEARFAAWIVGLGVVAYASMFVVLLDQLIRRERERIVNDALLNSGASIMTRTMSARAKEKSSERHYEIRRRARRARKLGGASDN